MRKLCIKCHEGRSVEDHIPRYEEGIVRVRQVASSLPTLPLRATLDPRAGYVPVSSIGTIPIRSHTETFHTAAEHTRIRRRVRRQTCHR